MPKDDCGNRKMRKQPCRRRMWDERVRAGHYKSISNNYVKTLA